MGPQEDYIETVLTCEGDYYDPDFHSQLDSFSQRLQQLIDTGHRKLILKKVEPWNSVRVTFNIPKEAAIRLKQLAEKGDQTLRALGILAVQIEGDRLISLTIAGKNNETTELVFRTSGTQGASPGSSMFDISSSDEMNLPGPSSVETTRKNIQQYLSQQGNVGTSIFDSIFSHGETSGDRVFKSPNVVATQSEPIPFRQMNQGQLSFNSPSRSPSHTSSHVPQYPLPAGRNATGYPTPASQVQQSFPSPSSSRAGQMSPVSPKFPTPPPSGSQPSTPNSPGMRAPSLPISFTHGSSNINNMQRVVTGNKGITSSSPLLVNLLQSDVSGGGHFNNLPLHKMPPPFDGSQQPKPRKRRPRKPKDSSGSPRGTKTASSEGEVSIQGLANTGGEERVPVPGRVPALPGGLPQPVASGAPGAYDIVSSVAASESSTSVHVTDRHSPGIQPNMSMPVPSPIAVNPGVTYSQGQGIPNSRPVTTLSMTLNTNTVKSTVKGVHEGLTVPLPSVSVASSSRIDTSLTTGFSLNVNVSLPSHTISSERDTNITNSLPTGQSHISEHLTSSTMNVAPNTSIANTLSHGLPISMAAALSTNVRTVTSTNSTINNVAPQVTSMLPAVSQANLTTVTTMALGFQGSNYALPSKGTVANRNVLTVGTVPVPTATAECHSEQLSPGHSAPQHIINPYTGLLEPVDSSLSGDEANVHFVHRTENTAVGVAEHSQDTEKLQGTLPQRRPSVEHKWSATDQSICITQPSSTHSSSSTNATVSWAGLMTYPSRSLSVSSECMLHQVAGTVSTARSSANIGINQTPTLSVNIGAPVPPPLPVETPANPSKEQAASRAQGSVSIPVRVPTAVDASMPEPAGIATLVTTNLAATTVTKSPETVVCPPVQGPSVHTEKSTNSEATAGICLGEMSSETSSHPQRSVEAGPPSSPPSVEKDSDHELDKSQNVENGVTVSGLQEPVEQIENAQCGPSDTALLEIDTAVTTDAVQQASIENTGAIQMETSELAAKELEENAPQKTAAVTDDSTDSASAVSVAVEEKGGMGDMQIEIPENDANGVVTNEQLGVIAEGDTVSEHAETPVMNEVGTHMNHDSELSSHSMDEQSAALDVDTSVVKENHQGELVTANDLEHDLDDASESDKKSSDPAKPVPVDKNIITVGYALSKETNMDIISSGLSDRLLNPVCKTEVPHLEKPVSASEAGASCTKGVSVLDTLLTKTNPIKMPVIVKDIVRDDSGNCATTVEPNPTENSHQVILNLKNPMDVLIKGTEKSDLNPGGTSITVKAPVNGDDQELWTHDGNESLSGRAVNTASACEPAHGPFTSGSAGKDSASLHASSRLPLVASVAAKQTEPSPVSMVTPVSSVDNTKPGAGPVAPTEILSELRPGGAQEHDTNDQMSSDGEATYEEKPKIPEPSVPPQGVSDEGVAPDRTDATHLDEQGQNGHPPPPCGEAAQETPATEDSTPPCTPVLLSSDLEDQSKVESVSATTDAEEPEDMTCPVPQSVSSESNAKASGSNVGDVPGAVTTSDSNIPDSGCGDGGMSEPAVRVAARPASEDQSSGDTASVQGSLAMTQQGQQEQRYLLLSSADQGGRLDRQMDDICNQAALTPPKSPGAVVSPASMSGMVMPPTSEKSAIVAEQHKALESVNFSAGAAEQSAIKEVNKESKSGLEQRMQSELKPVSSLISIKDVTKENPPTHTESKSQEHSDKIVVKHVSPTDKSPYQKFAHMDGTSVNTEIVTKDEIKDRHTVEPPSVVRHSQNKGISIMQPMQERDAAIREEGKKLQTVPDTKWAASSGPGSAPTRAESLAQTDLALDGGTTVMPPGSRKPPFTIANLLEDGKTKSDKLLKQKMVVVASTQTLVTCSNVSVSKTVLSLPRASTKSAYTRTVPSTPAMVSVGSDHDFPGNTPVHLHNFMKKSMHTPAFQNSPHPITAPGFPLNLTESVQKVMKPLPSGDNPTPPPSPVLSKPPMPPSLTKPKTVAVPVMTQDTPVSTSVPLSKAAVAMTTTATNCSGSTVCATTYATSMMVTSCVRSQPTSIAALPTSPRLSTQLTACHPSGHHSSSTSDTCPLVRHTDSASKAKTRLDGLSPAVRLNANRPMSAVPLDNHSSAVGMEFGYSSHMQGATSHLNSPATSSMQDSVHQRTHPAPLRLQQAAQHKVAEKSPVSDRPPSMGAKQEQSEEREENVSEMKSAKASRATISEYQGTEEDINTPTNLTSSLKLANKSPMKTKPNPDVSLSESKAVPIEKSEVKEEANPEMHEGLTQTSTHTSQHASQGQSGTGSNPHPHVALSDHQASVPSISATTEHVSSVSSPLPVTTSMMPTSQTTSHNQDKTEAANNSGLVTSNPTTTSSLKTSPIISASSSTGHLTETQKISTMLDIPSKPTANVTVAKQMPGQESNVKGTVPTETVKSGNKVGSSVSSVSSASETSTAVSGSNPSTSSKIEPRKAVEKEFSSIRDESSVHSESLSLSTFTSTASHTNQGPSGTSPTHSSVSPVTSHPVTSHKATHPTTDCTTNVRTASAVAPTGSPENQGAPSGMAASTAVVSTLISSSSLSTVADVAQPVHSSDGSAAVEPAQSVQTLASPTSSGASQADHSTENKPISGRAHQLDHDPKTQAASSVKPENSFHAPPLSKDSQLHHASDTPSLVAKATQPQIANTSTAGPAQQFVHVPESSTDITTLQSSTGSIRIDTAISASTPESVPSCTTSRPAKLPPPVDSKEGSSSTDGSQPVQSVDPGKVSQPAHISENSMPMEVPQSAHMSDKSLSLTSKLTPSTDKPTLSAPQLTHTSTRPTPTPANTAQTAPSLEAVASTTKTTQSVHSPDPAVAVSTSKTVTVLSVHTVDTPPTLSSTKTEQLVHNADTSAATRATRQSSHGPAESSSTSEDMVKVKEEVITKDTSGITATRGRPKATSESSENSETQLDGKTLRSGRATETSDVTSSRATRSTPRSGKRRLSPTGENSTDASIVVKTESAHERPESPKSVKVTRSSKRRLAMSDETAEHSYALSPERQPLKKPKVEDGASKDGPVEGKAGDSSDDDISLSELRTKGKSPPTKPTAGVGRGRSERASTEDKVSPKGRKQSPVGKDAKGSDSKESDTKKAANTKSGTKGEVDNIADIDTETSGRGRTKGRVPQRDSRNSLEEKPADKDSPTAKSGAKHNKDNRKPAEDTTKVEEEAIHEDISGRKGQTRRSGEKRSRSPPAGKEGDADDKVAVRSSGRGRGQVAVPQDKGKAEHVEETPEPVFKRATRSSKPKDHYELPPQPPANKRRRSSRDHR